MSSKGENLKRREQKNSRDKSRDVEELQRNSNELIDRKKIWALNSYIKSWQRRVHEKIQISELHLSMRLIRVRLMLELKKLRCHWRSRLFRIFKLAIRKLCLKIHDLWFLKIQISWWISEIYFPSPFFLFTTSDQLLRVVAGMSDRESGGRMNKSKLNYTDRSVLVPPTIEIEFQNFCSSFELRIIYSSNGQAFFGALRSHRSRLSGQSNFSSHQLIWSGVDFNFATKTSLTKSFCDKNSNLWCD